MQNNFCKISDFMEHSSSEKRPSKPVSTCPDCGSDLQYTWIGESLSFLFKHTGLSRAGWIPTPCGCARALNQADNSSSSPMVTDTRFKHAGISTITDARIRLTGVNELFLGKTFDDYRVENAKQSEVAGVVRTYTENFETIRKLGTWLLFLGSPGTGKTHLACAAVQSLAVRGYSAKYVKAGELFRRVKESWQDGTKERTSDVIKKMIDVDLLVIDELGGQFGSTAEQNILYDVIDGRYERKKPLIGTSNRDYGTLGKLIGNQCIDRFQDRACNSRIFVFDWPSHRSGICWS